MKEHRSLHWSTNSCNCGAKCSAECRRGKKYFSPLLHFIIDPLPKQQDTSSHSFCHCLKGSFFLKSAFLPPS
ncbi:hypothetical protein XELAEV_18037892mg [Xenopus laevis]|uniref:Uncharacterized protein n=1 Tax=Xenopus laevis TaxID=8355 RepID=A0A974CDN5_XENLA|nr:hypothetical protein XELAEV_18037892mg [Xenopus laevis]